jgi:hypothetical protein
MERAGLNPALLLFKKNAPAHTELEMDESYVFLTSVRLVYYPSP